MFAWIKKSLAKFATLDRSQTFMTAETHRSRRNMVGIGFAIILLWGLKLDINSFQIFGMQINPRAYNITCFPEPSAHLQTPVFSLKFVLRVVILYELLVFLSRLYNDFYAIHDQPGTYDGHMDAGWGLLSTRDKIKKTIEEVHGVMELALKSHPNTDLKAQYQQVLGNLEDTLKTFYKRSWSIAIKEATLFWLTEIIIPVVIAITAAFFKLEDLRLR
ncbi:MAG: hypothetical protein LUE17_05960 [Planctomycetaceae bacterium]|nr:hypothetical protein [Planctomycetaceae bacterium]